jgi:Mrp family chromosome partitioning ATPase
LAGRIANELGRPLLEVAGQLRRLGSERGGVAVVLAGCRRDAGCTSVALALACAAARQWSVLVIDGDAEGRGLSAGLDGASTAGWDHPACGAESYPDFLTRLDTSPALPLLPCGDAPQPDAGPSRPRTLGTLMSSVRADYELIVVDGGTAAGSAPRWVPWTDAAVLVLPCGGPPDGEWAAAWDRLEERGARVFGVIETLA